MLFKKLKNFVFTTTKDSHNLLLIDREINGVRFYDVIQLVNEDGRSSFMHLGIIHDLKDLTTEFVNKKEDLTSEFEIYCTKDKVSVSPGTAIVPFTVKITLPD